MSPASNNAFHISRHLAVDRWAIEARIATYLIYSNATELKRLLAGDARLR